MENIELNVNYDSDGTLEFEILRKSILEKLVTEFRTKNFNIQFNEFFSVQDTEYFDIVERLQKLGNVYCTKPNSFIISREDGFININVVTRQDKKVLNCLLYSDSQVNIKKILKEIPKHFTIVKNTRCNINVRWYYIQSNNRLDYTVIPETINETVLPQAYPYIPDLNKFIQSYLESTEPVLVLVGLAGTGKTRLLRHIVREIAAKMFDAKAEKYDTGYSDPYEIDDHFVPTFSYTNDSKAMRSDEMFVDFIGDGNIYGMVMEDMDETLKPRQEGNNIMSKLLSSSDGFISNYNKKMLLTSNIANANNIDSAFKRPGRCYGVIKTRKLTGMESVELIKVISPGADFEKLIDIKSEYTVADLYKLAREAILPASTSNNTIGFLP
jgi:hypothetical protein